MPHLEFDDRQGHVFRVEGSKRTLVAGLRPQEYKVLRYLNRRNRENGDNPAPCGIEDLIRELWGDRKVGDAKGNLARVVFELRRRIEVRPDRPCLLETVGGGCYRLLTRPWSPVDGQAAFVCGPPVMKPRGFFGRNSELNRIFDLWRREPFQHIAINGRQRSGKTSLLRYLETIHVTPASELRPNQRQNWLPDASRYRFVFVDFQDARMHDLGTLLRHITAGMGTPALRSGDLGHFLDLVSEHLTGPTIILMDEIEAGFAVNADFWSALRSLAAMTKRGPLGFLVTLQCGRDTLFRDYPNLSRFLNVFGHELNLGALTPEEAQEFIASSPLPFSESDTQWIMRESKLYPCIIQLLCDSLFRYLENSQTGGVWRVEASRRIRYFHKLLE